MEMADVPFPHPEHECEGCNLGKELLVGAISSFASSIVGRGAIHLPEGWVCEKYLSPEAYAAYQNLKRSRMAAPTPTEAENG
jgi:hypothetical protein